MTFMPALTIETALPAIADGDQGQDEVLSPARMGGMSPAADRE
jgi:hypothetical protein